MSDVPSIADLRELLREAGLSIGPGDVVSERAAAMLVGREPKTLRNWRSIGHGPEAIADGRVRYRLDDIWLYLATRCDRRRRAA
jgi:hypothetical protein